MFLPSGVENVGRDTRVLLLEVAHCAWNQEMLFCTRGNWNTFEVLNTASQRPSGSTQRIWLQVILKSRCRAHLYKH